LAESRQMLKRLGKEQLLIQSGDLACPWQLLPACDAAVYFGSAGGSLACYWAMFLGVPVAASVKPVAEGRNDDLLIDQKTCLVSSQNNQRLLSYSISRLLDDCGLSKKLSAAASSAANKRFDLKTYRANLNDIYNQL